MLKDITVSIISGPLMTVNKSKIRAGMYLSSSENYLSPAGLMKTTPGGTFTFNEMRGGPRAVNINFTLAPSTWIIGKKMIIVLGGRSPMEISLVMTLSYKS